MIFDTQVDGIIVVHVHILECLVAVVLVSEGNAGRVDRKEGI